MILQSNENSSINSPLQVYQSLLNGPTTEAWVKHHAKSPFIRSDSAKAISRDISNYTFNDISEIRYVYPQELRTSYLNREKLNEFRKPTQLSFDFEDNNLNNPDRSRSLRARTKSNQRTMTHHSQQDMGSLFRTPLSYAESILSCVVNRILFEMKECKDDGNNRLGVGVDKIWDALESFPNETAVRKFTGVDAGAAFRVNSIEGRIEFNAAPLTKLQGEVSRRVPHKDSRHNIILDGIRGFVLHELYHLSSQNFVYHADARSISNMASPFFLAMMDLSADIFAAKYASGLECAKRGCVSERAYQHNLYEQLLIGLDFWVPLMKCPPTKRHKQMRFWGQAIMAARLIDAMCGDGLGTDPIAPFDAPLFPLVDFEKNEMMIIAFMPEHVIWLPTVEINPVVIQDILDGLETRPAADTIQISGRLLRILGR